MKTDNSKLVAELDTGHFFRTRPDPHLGPNE